MTIPQNLLELKDLKQWVNFIRVWNATKKEGKGGFDKPLVNPYTLRDAKNNDPTHWTTYEQAAASVGKTATHRDTKHKDAQGNAPIIRKPIEGVGLIIAGGLCGVDLDDVIDDDGNIAPFAAAIVDRLDTYTEISPSGHGLHLLLFCGDILNDAKAKEINKFREGIAAGLEKDEAIRRAKGKFDFGKQFTLDAAGEITDDDGKRYELEIYFYIRGGRYLTVTGNVYRDRPINRAKGAELIALRDEYTEKKKAYDAAKKPASTVGTHYTTFSPATADEERQMIESALAAIDPGDLNGYKEWAPIMSALYVMGFPYEQAEEWSSGRLSRTINPINNPASNERRWSRGNFRLQDPANAAGIIIKKAKYFGWKTADAFDDEARAEYGRRQHLDEEARTAYGRSLHTEEERREYGRERHRERLDKWWNDHGHEDDFQKWKARKENPQQNATKTENPTE